MDVIIVCHTEYGYVRDRDLVLCKVAPAGVTDGVATLASVADRYGAKVTFAVAPEAAEHFPDNVRHEVGLNLHPGAEKLRAGKRRVLVGDKYLRQHCTLSTTSTLLHDYSFEEQRQMISTGKERIREALGVVPKVFVAGRWSLDNNSTRVLVEEGFTHDCSAAPNRRSSHYDWTRLPRICMPYRPDAADYQRRGKLPLLIMPISQSLLGVSATPELAPLVGLPWLKACFEEYYRQGMPLFHMYLHSPLMTEEYYVDIVDSLLRFIAGHENVNFRFASEIREYSEIRPVADVRPYLAGINRSMLNAGPAMARRMIAAVRTNAEA